MALYVDRNVEHSDITRILDDVASPGVVLVYKTAGSGSAIGDSAGKTQLLATTPSGQKVHGVLLQNFVSIDETKYHINWHKDEQQVQSPANVMRKGWVITDKVTGTPTDGAPAYLTLSGLVTPTVHATGGVAGSPLVGEFGGVKDEAGYVKLIVNLPA